MSLKKYIAEQNQIVALWHPTDPVPYPSLKITATQKQALLERIETDLSPEALTCDGERPRAQVRSRSIMLNKAKEELEAIKV